MEMEVGMTDEQAVRRLQDLLVKDSPYSESELTELRTLAIQTFFLPNKHSFALPLRSAVEVIDSIRRFDKASADLIETTNRLTRWILGLTVLATILGAGSIVASGWPYLTWWISHGFHLR